MAITIYDLNTIGYFPFRSYFVCINYITSEPDGDIIMEAIDLTKKDVVVPSVIYTLPVHIIGLGAFSCTDIESVEIPSCITLISTGAFYGCKNLKKVKLEEGLQKIDAGAFAFCEQLEEIELPASVKHVSRSAFIGCSNLKSIKLRGNGNIEDLYDIDITGKKENIQSDFEKDGCQYRVSSYTDRTIEIVDAPRGINDLEIPSTIRWMENDWTVTGIGEGCFSESQLTNIKLPSTIKTIGNYAFYGCTALEHINLPEGIISIGGCAFCMDIALKDLPLPSSLVKLGIGALYRCIGLKEISIPQGIVRIPDYAFYGCRNANIVFPETTGLKAIGRNALYDNNVMTELNIPESVDTVDYIGYFTNLESVKLPDKLRMIGGFHHCPKLSAIHIPDGITTIYNFAFAHNEKLSSIHWPKYLQYIRPCAFADTGFTTIEMPDTVWADVDIIDVGRRTVPNYYSIGDGAFSNCKNLEKVDLGKSCWSVYKEAFRGCEQLRTVVVKSTTPPDYFDQTLISDEDEDGPTKCFSSSTYILGTLYVPTGSKDDYAKAVNWRSFMNIEEIDIAEEPSGMVMPKDNSQMEESYYSLDGKQLKTPQKGINIIKSGGKTRKVIIPMQP